MNISFYTNCRSIVNKIEILIPLLKSAHYSVLIFTETWLHNEINDQILTADTDYSIIRSDRTKKRGVYPYFYTIVLAL